MLAARLFQRVRRTIARHAFPGALPGQHTDGGREVLRGPEQPAVDVGARLRRLRIDRLARHLLGQVLHDGARFPQQEIAIGQHGHFAVRVQFGQAAAVVRIHQVDFGQFQRQAEVDRRHQGTTGIRRHGVVVQAHDRWLR
ncbi:hypothetical protein D3C81_1739150 [compost metagenome]